MKKFKLLKEIEKEDSLPLWSTITIDWEYCKIDNPEWYIPTQWLVEQWYLEEVTEKDCEYWNIIWKDIPKFPWYKASNTWLIKSMNYNNTGKEKILRQWFVGKWYLHLTIWWKNILSHRAVASAFLSLDLDDSKTLVCHKDDDPTNNNILNLFIWTYSDNEVDKIKKWRRKAWLHNGAKLSVTDVSYIRENYEPWHIYFWQKPLAKQFNVSKKTIQDVTNWNWYKWTENAPKVSKVKESNIISRTMNEEKRKDIRNFLELYWLLEE